MQVLFAWNPSNVGFKSRNILTSASILWVRTTVLIMTTANSQGSQGGRVNNLLAREAHRKGKRLKNIIIGDFGGKMRLVPYTTSSIPPSLYRKRRCSDVSAMHLDTKGGENTFLHNALSTNRIVGFPHQQLHLFLSFSQSTVTSVSAFLPSDSYICCCLSPERHLHLSLSSS